MEKSPLQAAAESLQAELNAAIAQRADERKRNLGSLVRLRNAAELQRCFAELRLALGDTGRAKLAECAMTVQAACGAESAYAKARQAALDALRSDLLKFVRPTKARPGKQPLPICSLLESSKRLLHLPGLCFTTPQAAAEALKKFRELPTPQTLAELEGQWKDADAITRDPQIAGDAPGEELLRLQTATTAALRTWQDAITAASAASRKCGPDGWYWLAAYCSSLHHALLPVAPAERLELVEGAAAKLADDGNLWVTGDTPLAKYRHPGQVTIGGQTMLYSATTEQDVLKHLAKTGVASTADLQRVVGNPAKVIGKILERHPGFLDRHLLRPARKGQGYQFLCELTG